MSAPRKTALLVGLILFLWFLMALMTRVWLVPKKMPYDYDLYPRWYGARALLLHGENPYSEPISRQVSVQMGYPDTPDQFPHRFYYFATVIWILLPLWLLPFSISIVIWAGLQLMLLFTLPLLVFWLLQWRIRPFLLAAVCVFSTIPWRHSANSYVLGQFTIFTLGCLVIAWAAVVKNRPWLAAAALIGSTVRVEGALITAAFLLDLLLTRHYQIVKIWIGMMAVIFILSLISTGFWLPDFMRGMTDYRNGEPNTFPPDILGNELLIVGATTAVVIWGLWMLVKMRSLSDRYRIPWSLSVVALGALLVLTQTKDYTLVYALLPIWVILWAGRDQVWMIPLVLLILISPWLYDAAKANLGHDNPIEQFVTPLILAVLLTYQWRRWKAGAGRLLIDE